MKKSSNLFLFILFACVSAASLPSVAHPFYSPSPGEQIRSNLYLVQADASTILLDGDLTQYDPSFSNTVDGMDARKMSNFSENLGMIRGTTTLVIERRHTIDVTDTIFYKLWNTRETTYQLEFVTSNLNHPGLAGYLEDTYLHRVIALNLNGANNINFKVTSDPGSSAMYRFRIVFTTASAAVLPLTFTSVKAYQQNNNINITWKTANEQDMKYYNVQRSTDGSHFSSGPYIAVAGLPVNDYSWTDPYPANGYNYYRILSTDITGKITYSEILKIYSGKEIASIKVFPNPVTDNTIHLQIVNQPGGLYKIKLVNSSGQSVIATQIQHTEGTSIETIMPSLHIPKGIYQLEVTRPDGSRISIHLMY